MACGCGCNGAPGGCQDNPLVSGLSGLGQVSSNENSLGLLVIAGVLYFLWRGRKHGYSRSSGL